MGWLKARSTFRNEVGYGRCFSSSKPDGKPLSNTPPESPALSARGLSFSYDGHHVLHNVDVGPLPTGSVTALVGPNGAGKSTLLRCLAGLENCSGQVRAERSLYLPQDPPPLSSLTVYESVLLARQQSFSGFSALRVGSTVRAEVQATIEQLGLVALSSRLMSQLSGGQRQLVSFAQAVVRRPRVLLLDEPTSALDLHNQLTLLEQVRKCARELPCAVVMSLHDLGQAARFCEHVVILTNGQVRDAGSPAEVINEDMLRDVYQVQGEVLPTSDGGLAVEASEAL
ncbi:MAG: ABC transporter ATP-binding protein [Corynebacterium sp.]|uniref:ABC transporter ATP-binding protein n=1 Tax=Corynebacterium sp. TaxID=1720 RepID=UPI0026DCF2BC|nr:ABC transporter ATP-binding protein [Corynebacterium sp.]MDO5030856.1 ABC transporter ATP-binding protein [Corynebacterium sp.]